MKLSEKWLRERVSPRLTVRQLAERLTMAGLEVGAVTPAAPPLDGVVAGEILSVAPHPDAERLRVCAVDTGEKRPRTIVCGAANAAAGLKAPVALPGASLPGDRLIAESEIRGVKSSGMLCSAQDLGLEESSDGLLVLETTAKPGAALTKLLALDDSVLEIDLTPNRGDCLSVTGIARDVAALTGAALKPLTPRRAAIKSRKRVKVALDAPQDCPVYVGRVIEGIDPHAVTPAWMKERLRRSGLRAIHPVVDVTNYVLLELGQPMHAFDLDKLSGTVRARQARQGDTLTLLDGKQIAPDAGTLLIADDKKPLALAGIMGGLDSAVGATTRHLFLECAHFRPEIIAGRARTLGLQTESSQRFERGVDPALPRRAMERATEMLLAVVGGQAGPLTEKASKRHLPVPVPITLRAARLARVLGRRVPPTQVAAILKRLGMKVKPASGGWRVLPPSYRFDVSREVDLIEEIARVHGYASLPATRPRLDMRARPVPEGRLLPARLRTLLTDRDYQEVITYSFVDPALQGLLEPAIAPLRLANPIAADMAVMRTTLWAGLLATVAYNLNRQSDRLRIFELGRRFRPQAGTLSQEPALAGAVTGLLAAPQWGLAGRAADFFDVKADVQALLALTGHVHAFRFRAARHPALHPGMTAEILSAAGPAGWVGALHPDLVARLRLSQPVYLFELTLSAVERADIPVYREISRFPAIHRDLAVVVDEGLPADSVLESVRNVAGNLLVKLELFDEYRGKGIDSGRKSLALGLTLQESSRTLKDSEVDAVMGQVLRALETEFGARIRQ